MENESKSGSSDELNDEYDLAISGNIVYNSYTEGNLVNSEIKIETHDFKDGFYILEYTNGESRIVKSFIINH